MLNELVTNGLDGMQGCHCWQGPQGLGFAWILPKYNGKRLDFSEIEWKATAATVARC